MLPNLDEVIKRFELLERRLSDPDIFSVQSKYVPLAKEHSDLAPIVNCYRDYLSAQIQIEENTSLLEDPDPEIREMAELELAESKERAEKRITELKVLLLPKDPYDEKNILLEIRAGTGGEEAALFAAELFRMYSRYAETHAWKVELLSTHETGIGGFKEIICSIEGKNVFSRLK